MSATQSGAGTWPMASRVSHRPIGHVAVDLESDVIRSSQKEAQRHRRLEPVEDEKLRWPDHHVQRILSRASLQQTERHAAALDSFSDGTEQRIVVERLGQKLDGSRLHRLHRHRHISIPGDEDDRHFRSVGELLLQLETVRPGIVTSGTRQLGTVARG